MQTTALCQKTGSVSGGRAGTEREEEVIGRMDYKEI